MADMRLPGPPLKTYGNLPYNGSASPEPGQALEHDHGNRRDDKAAGSTNYS